MFSPGWLAVKLVVVLAVMEPVSWSGSASSAMAAEKDVLR